MFSSDANAEKASAYLFFGYTISTWIVFVVIVVSTLIIVYLSTRTVSLPIVKNHTTIIVSPSSIVQTLMKPNENNGDFLFDYKTPVINGPANMEIRALRFAKSNASVLKKLAIKTQPPKVDQLLEILRKERERKVFKTDWRKSVYIDVNSLSSSEKWNLSPDKTPSAGINTNHRLFVYDGLIAAGDPADKATTSIEHLLSNTLLLVSVPQDCFFKYLSGGLYLSHGNRISPMLYIKIPSVNPSYPYDVHALLDGHHKLDYDYFSHNDNYSTVGTLLYVSNLPLCTVPYKELFIGSYSALTHDPKSISSSLERLNKVLTYEIEQRPKSTFVIEVCITIGAPRAIDIAPFVQEFEEYNNMDNNRAFKIIKPSNYVYDEPADLARFQFDKYTFENNKEMYYYETMRFRLVDTRIDFSGPLDDNTVDSSDRFIQINNYTWRNYPLKVRDTEAEKLSTQTIAKDHIEQTLLTQPTIKDEDAKLQYQSITKKDEKGIFLTQLIKKGHEEGIPPIQVQKPRRQARAYRKR